MIRQLLIIFFCIIISNVAYSQNVQLESKIARYVTSKEGLNVRDKPSRTGDKVGVLLYGSKIRLAMRSENTETIDGITDYWYGTNPHIDYRHNIGWVFGGYLSETMPEDTASVLGEWKIEGKDKYYYWRFRPDGYVVHDNYITGFGLLRFGKSIGGKWTLQENNLIITTEWVKTPWIGNVEFRRVIEIIRIAVTVVNRDRIIFKISDGSEQVLIRNNDP
jgi:hypothetical protein